MVALGDVVVGYHSRTIVATNDIVNDIVDRVTIDLYIVSLDNHSYM